MGFLSDNALERRHSRTGSHGCGQLVASLLLIVCSVLAGGWRFPDREAYWEKFPEPPGRAQGVSWIGEDRGGCVWIMSGQGTYSWNASERKWSTSLLGAGQYLTQLYGDAKTGLYATQRGKEEHWGEVFSLEEGGAKCVTSFYYDVAHNAPGFYVAGKDRFLNWGGGKLRVYVAGKWIEEPADLPQVGTQVFDTGNAVTLYAEGRLYVVDRKGRIHEAEADGAVSRQATKGALWGAGKAIVLEYGAAGVAGFDVRTGRVADTGKINRALDGRNVYDLFSTPGGDVWIMAYDRPLESYVLLRVKPDGTATLISDTAGIPWDNHQFTHSPRSVLIDRRGAVWFASYELGVSCLADGKLRQFDSRIDKSPLACGTGMESSTRGLPPAFMLTTKAPLSPVWRRRRPFRSPRCPPPSGGATSPRHRVGCAGRGV
jgi:hypothetical protein